MDSFLDTVESLFLAHGFSGTSLEMIARDGCVAVRTIYARFGEKSGLFSAIIARRNQSCATDLADLASDTRSLTTVVFEFGKRFLELISSRESIELQRIAITEASCIPGSGSTAYSSEFEQVHAVLVRFFERHDVQPQLRDDLDLAPLPALLINCVIGDPIHRFLFAPDRSMKAERDEALKQRLDLFFRAVLR
jgi:TetR/AcrR family transcriptional repressor of mexJK operon